MMQSEELIRKVTKIFPRDNGTEARVVAYSTPNIGIGFSIGFYVHRRESPDHDWWLCSDRPHPDWKKMSREEYLAIGRSEALQAVSHGEILSVLSLLGQPMSALN